MGRFFYGFSPSLIIQRIKLNNPLFTKNDNNN